MEIFQEVADYCRNGNGPYTEMMAGYSLPTISDVLADCALATSEDNFSDFDDTSIFGDMATTLHECTAEEAIALTENDFLNTDAIKSMKDNLEQGEDLHLLQGTTEEELLGAMWPPIGEENFPEEVLIEVEVITSWIDEKDDRTIIDLDTDLSKSPDSNGELSDYGSETDHTSDMDHCHNGSLDLSRSGPYRDLNSTISMNNAQPLVRPPSYHNNGCLDLSLKPASNGISNGSLSNYIHFSGGTTLDLSKTSDMDHSGILDLRKNGTYIQMPRIKLEPGLGIDPTITYKPEMDFNHNFPTNMMKNHHFAFSEENELKDEQKGSFPEMNDNSLNQESRVKVEELYSSPCQIPLTVTSPDDDIDSGTESIDSKDSEKSNIDNKCSDNSKLDRKRPGRKKGQVSKVYHLWEFIRDVLADPKYCPTVIKWENEDEGIFRVVQSEVAATMWGAKKNNRTKMTYEKMSRSIRYSRKEGYFGDIPKDKGYPKKLCFKFGKKAHGWNVNRSAGAGTHVR